MCIESYAAGLVDGEGSIGAYKLQAGYQLVIRIRMVDVEPLELLKKHFGGVLYPAGKTKTGRQTWHWQMTGTECQWILQILLPFLVCKKYQAQLALDFPVMGAGGRPNDTERSQRDSIAKALKEAKHG